MAWINDKIEEYQDSKIRTIIFYAVEEFSEKLLNELSKIMEKGNVDEVLNISNKLLGQTKEKHVI